MHCDYIHDLGYDLCVKPRWIGGYSHGLRLKIKTWKYIIPIFFSFVKVYPHFYRSIGLSVALWNRLRYVGVTPIWLTWSSGYANNWMKIIFICLIILFLFFMLLWNWVLFSIETSYPKMSNVLLFLIWFSFFIIFFILDPFIKLIIFKFIIRHGVSWELCFMFFLNWVILASWLKLYI